MTNELYLLAGIFGWVMGVAFFAGVFRVDLVNESEPQKPLMIILWPLVVPFMVVVLPYKLMRRFGLYLSRPRAKIPKATATVISR